MLVKCPDCGKEVSNEALYCPRCRKPYPGFIPEKKVVAKYDSFNRKHPNFLKNMPIIKKFIGDFIDSIEMSNEEMKNRRH